VEETCQGRHERVEIDSGEFFVDGGICYGGEFFYKTFRPWKCGNRYIKMIMIIKKMTKENTKTEERHKQIERSSRERGTKGFVTRYMKTKT